MPQTADLSRECLHTALLQLMETTPYEKISITDITNRAGVSRMAYYRNYESKEDILLQQSRKLLSDFEESILADETVTAQNFWARYFRKFYAEPIVAALLMANQLDAMSHQHTRTTFRIFSRKFGWDMEKSENAMFLYSRIGAIVGLIHYAVEYAEIFELQGAERLLDAFKYIPEQK